MQQTVRTHNAMDTYVRLWLAPETKLDYNMGQIHPGSQLKVFSKELKH